MKNYKTKSDDVLNKAYEKYHAQATEQNLSELLEASGSLIRYLARYFCGGRVDSDVLQAGYEGILKAVKYYDAGFNTCFSTYAGHFIIGEVRHYIRREMRFYRPPILDALQKKAQGLSLDYYEENGSLPPVSHLAHELNVREEGVHEIFRAGLVSIDELDIDKIKCLHHESFQLPIEDQIVLYESIRKLSELKRSVIYSLFFQNRTQQQTAESLGINQRKVSRLLKSSLVDLKEYLT